MPKLRLRDLLEIYRHAGVVFPRASSLDDPEVFQPKFTVYTGRSPSWDRPNPGLPAFDEMPPPEIMADMPK